MSRTFTTRRRAFAESEQRYRHLVESGRADLRSRHGRAAAVGQSGGTRDDRLRRRAGVIGQTMRAVLSPISREVFSLYLERMEHVGHDPE